MQLGEAGGIDQQTYSAAGEGFADKVVMAVMSEVTCDRDFSDQMR